MRKVIMSFLLLGALSFGVTSCNSDDDEVRIDYVGLPEGTRAFLENNVSNNTGLAQSDILYIEHDKKDGTYEVHYKNGIEIDFYSNGVWKDINLNNNIIPSSIQSILPEKALLYIQTYYPNLKIDEIEKQGVYSTNQNIKIEFTNDWEIYFDYQGNVLTDNNNSNSTGNTNPVTGNNTNTSNSQLLASVNTFLANHFPNQNYTYKYSWFKIEVTFNEDANNEIEIDFDKESGKFLSIDLEENTNAGNTIIRNVIKDITGSSNILNYIDSNTTEFAGTYIEEFSVASTISVSNGGYVVKLDGQRYDYKLYFDADSKFVNKVID